MSNPPVVLAVAGTDSGGAAGLAADLTTIAALGGHGAMVVAAVTAQDTTGVHAVHAIPADIVEAQLDAVLADLPVAAVKTGMLGSPEAVALVAERCADLRLVVDPVLAATSGAALATEEVRVAYLEHLLPVATVITPNRGEALALLGLPGDDPTPSDELATRLAAYGCAVVVTGGPDDQKAHLEAPQGASRPECVDWLALPDARAPTSLSHPAVDTTNDHGTGCTYASALATFLAHGEPLPTAASRAAAYVTDQLTISSTWTLGRGRGPVAHTHKEMSA